MDEHQQNQEFNRKSALQIVTGCLNAINDLNELYQLGEETLKTDLLAQRAFVQRLCELGEALTFLREDNPTLSSINWIKEKSGTESSFLEKFTSARNLLTHDYPKEVHPNSPTFHSMLSRYTKNKENLDIFKSNLSALENNSALSDPANQCKKPMTLGGEPTTMFGPLDYLKKTNVEIQLLKNYYQKQPDGTLKINSSLPAKFHSVVLRNFVGNICNFIDKFENLLTKSPWTEYKSNKPYKNELFNQLSEEEKNFYKTEIKTLRRQIAHAGENPISDEKLQKAIEKLFNLSDTYTVPLSDYLSFSLLGEFAFQVPEYNQFVNEFDVMANAFATWYKFRPYTTEELSSANVLTELLVEFRNFLESFKKVSEHFRQQDPGLFYDLDHQTYSSLYQAQFESVQQRLEYLIPQIELKLNITNIKIFINRLKTIPKEDVVSSINAYSAIYYPTNPNAPYDESRLTDDVLEVYVRGINNLKNILLSNAGYVTQNLEELVSASQLLIHAEQEAKKKQESILSQSSVDNTSLAMDVDESYTSSSQTQNKHAESSKRQEPLHSENPATQLAPTTTSATSTASTTSTAPTMVEPAVMEIDKNPNQNKKSRKRKEREDDTEMQENPKISKRDMDKTRQELERLQGEHFNLKNILQKTQADLEAHKSNLEEAKQKLEPLEKSNKHLENENNTLKNTLEKTQIELKENKSRLEEANGEIRELKTQVTHLEKENSQFTSTQQSSQESNLGQSSRYQPLLSQPKPENGSLSLNPVNQQGGAPTQDNPSNTPTNKPSSGQ